MIQIYYALDDLAKDLSGMLASDPKLRSNGKPLILGIIYNGSRTHMGYLTKHLRSMDFPFDSGVIDASLYPAHNDPSQKRRLGRMYDDSHIPFDVNGRKVILFDEIIRTGRVSQAALRTLMDYGRPDSITLTGLLDIRKDRELPVTCNHAGLRLGNEKPDLSYVQKHCQDYLIWKS